MAIWCIIEHGDQRDARVLSEYRRHDEARREFKVALQVRERMGWKTEQVQADVWLCFKPVKGGTWDANASVLRLITAHEWRTDWLPVQQREAVAW